MWTIGEIEVIPAEVRGRAEARLRDDTAWIERQRRWMDGARSPLMPPMTDRERQWYEDGWSKAEGRYRDDVKRWAFGETSRLIREAS